MILACRWAKNRQLWRKKPRFQRRRFLQKKPRFRCRFRIP